MVFALSLLKYLYMLKTMFLAVLFTRFPLPGMVATDDFKGSTSSLSLVANSWQYTCSILNYTIQIRVFLRMPQVCKVCAENAYVNFRSQAAAYSVGIDYRTG